jgi:hypothetical protein
MKYHPVVSCRVNTQYITWNSHRGSNICIKTHAKASPEYKYQFKSKFVGAEYGPDTNQ